MASKCADGPTPGIYHDMPFEEYAALPYWNASALKRLYLSPRAAKYGLATRETPAMKTGTLVHMALLEPERFERECVVMPNFHGSMKEETAREKGYDGGKQAKAEWLEAHKDATILEGAERDEVVGIASAFQACEPARQIIEASQREVTIIWDDPIGLRCKARLDCLLQTESGSYVVADVKKTSSVHPRSFNGQAGRLRYFLQAAFYLRAVASHFERPYDPYSETPDRFLWIAFESNAPHFCRVFNVSNTAREAAHWELESVMRTVAWCEREQHWPDLAEQVVELEMPYHEPYTAPEGVGVIEDE